MCFSATDCQEQRDLGIVQVPSIRSRPCAVGPVRLGWRPFRGRQGLADMDVLFVPLLRLLANAIDLYVWIVVIGVVLSWLAAFNVVNMSNRFVYMAADFIHRITEPALRPIRNFLPNLGGFDVSPVALILILIAAQEVVFRLIVKIA